MPLLQLESIHYSYPGRENSLLCGAGLILEPGMRLGLVGANGSGKSTLLHIAAGLIRPESGRVLHKGKTCETEEDFAAFRLRLGYLLQNAEDQLFCPSVLEDVAFGPYNQGYDKKEAERIARKTLEDMGLTHLAASSGSRLSGGEKKMAALASILSMQPELLFLDEPTNDLDPKSREKLLRILKECALPCVLISHDWSFLSEACTEFCLLQNGSIGPLPVTAHGHVHSHPAPDAHHIHGEDSGV